MGFLQDFGLDEIVPALVDLANEVNGIKDDLLGGLKDDIVQPIQSQVTDLKGTVQESIDSLNGPSS